MFARRHEINKIPIKYKEIKTESERRTETKTTLLSEKEFLEF